MSIEKAGRSGKGISPIKRSAAGSVIRLSGKMANADLFKGIHFRTSEGVLKALSAKRITREQAAFLRLTQQEDLSITREELRIIWPLFRRISLDPSAKYYKQFKLASLPETAKSMRLTIACSIHDWSLNSSDGSVRILISGTSPIIIKDVGLDRIGFINHLRMEQDGRILLRGTKI